MSGELHRRGIEYSKRRERRGKGKKGTIESLEKSSMCGLLLFHFTIPLMSKHLLCQDNIGLDEELSFEERYKYYYCVRFGC